MSTRSNKIRVVHVINSLQQGGAEAMLCNLLLRKDRAQFDSKVVALIDDLAVAAPLIKAGFEIEVIGMRPGVPDPRGVWRLASYLRRSKPDVIQSWMDHSNLITSMATLLMRRRPPHVWGVHHSHHIAEVTKRMTLATVSACAKLSSWLPARVVCCSEYATSMYGQGGFDPRKLMVIPNGFDTEKFHPDPDARASVRRELGIGADAKLIGLVARFDPLKDHGTFLAAAGRLVKRVDDVHFVLCGSGVEDSNEFLASRIAHNGLGTRVHLLGPRSDVARIHASLDLGSLSSISEAFPLTLGEAMSCGVPCVATNVGDSALIVGDTGEVVPAADPMALSAAWERLLNLPQADRAALGARARQRVQTMFDLSAVTRRYEALYCSLVPQFAHSAIGVEAEIAGLEARA